MEPWFLSVLVATLLAGLSNFAFKVASKRDYNGELFSLYGGLLNMLLLPLAYFYGGEFVGWFLVFVMLVVGAVGAVNNVAKIIALRFVDTSIYFPLYKTITPALAIVYGVYFFDELFSAKEWLGLFLGLLVPLVMIHKSDFKTQNNLTLGLWLVILTGVISAGAAALNKYATIFSGGAVLQLVAFASVGIVLGSLVSFFYKNRKKNLVALLQDQTNVPLVGWAFARAGLITASMWFMLLAFSDGAPLAIANTIQSFYFLIPIVLSVMFYKEKIGWRRLLAIVLCMLTLVLFA